VTIKTKPLSVTKTNDTATNAERRAALDARKHASIDREQELRAELQQLIVENEAGQRLHGDPVVGRRIGRQIRDKEAAIAAQERETAAINAELEPLIRAERQRECARAAIAKRGAMERMAKGLREAAAASRELQDDSDLLANVHGCPTFWPELDTRGGGRLAHWLHLFDTLDFDALREAAK
jgi:hypothetical protein